MISETMKKFVKKLHQKKYREELGAFFVEGVKGVEELLDSEYLVEHIIYDKQNAGNGIQRIIDKAKEKLIKISTCSEVDGKYMSATETFSGIIAIAKQKDEVFENMPLTKPIILLDGVADPGNLGTIIRTVDWFGNASLVISENCVDMYNPKVVRSTMGSLFRQHVYQSKNIVQQVQGFLEYGYVIAGLRMEGKDISTVDFAKKTVYIFGSESHGIRAELQSLIQKMYAIPGSGKAESLNVAIACGILLHEISR